MKSSPEGVGSKGLRRGCHADRLKVGATARRWIATTPRQKEVRRRRGARTPAERRIAARPRRVVSTGTRRERTDEDRQHVDHNGSASRHRRGVRRGHSEGGQRQQERTDEDHRVRTVGNGRTKIVTHGSQTGLRPPPRHHPRPRRQRVGRRDEPKPRPRDPRRPAQGRVLRGPPRHRRTNRVPASQSRPGHVFRRDSRDGGAAAHDGERNPQRGARGAVAGASRGVNYFWDGSRHRRGVPRGYSEGIFVKTQAPAP